MSDNSVALKVVGATAVVAGGAWALAAARRARLRGEPFARNEPVAHGGELVADVLAAHNVRIVFTLVGGHVSPVLVAVRQRGARVIDVRHEANAVFAADAAARLGSAPGVACVTAGPGVANALCALKNAAMARSPLVLLGGATAGLLRGRGALQDVDQAALVHGACKWHCSVARVADIVPMLDHAFFVARSGVPGPVFVELPIDVLYPPELVRSEFLGKLSNKTDIGSRALKFYLEHWYLRRLHQGMDSLCHSRPRAVPQLDVPRYQVQRAAQLLRGAARPMMILGTAVVADTERVALAADAARTMNVPMWLSGGARGLLGPADPLHMKHKRSQALKSADCVILCGVPADFRLQYGQAIRASATLISCNPSREELYLNRTPTLAIHGNPALFLIHLADQLRGERTPRHEWLAEVRQTDAARHAEIEQKADVAPQRNANPLRVCQEIDRALDDNSVVVADGGDFIGTAAYILRPRGPLSWLDPGPFGTLGVGAGFAMGAKLMRPDAEVWLLYGDGSFGFSAMEFDTLVRHRLPVIAVIGNDSSWQQIAREQVPTFKDDVACTLREEVEYEGVVRALGGVGWRVSDAGADHVEPDGNHVRPALLADVLQAAKAAARAGKPCVVNVLLDKSDFREGSISV